MAAQDPTSPDSAFSDASQVGAPKRDWQERLGGALAGSDDRKNSPLRQALDAHHQRRMDEAEMHKKNAATAAGALAYGIDPATGQPLTDEQKATYKNQYDAAMGHYEKIVGVDKNTKSAMQRARAIVEHLISRGGGQGGQDGQQGRPGGLTPPPQPQGAQAKEPTFGTPGHDNVGSAGITPPPQAPGADDKEAAYKQFSTQAPFLRQQMEQRQALNAYTDKEKALYELKIKEDAAKSKAKSAAHPTRPAPGQYSTSVLDARTTGQVYMGFDGNPIDLDKVPDTMGLKGTLVYNPDTDGWDVRYTTFSPNQSTITVGGETFAINPMDKSKLTQGQGQDLGAHNISTTTRTTDPATGQTTVSKRTPQITGVGGRPGSTSITPPPQPQEASPRRSSSGTGGAPLSKTADIQLDDSGHIPNTWHGASPQVIEGANQLKDGMDLKDIGGTSKTKPLSEALARRAFGWSRDKFTPLEHTQIALASRYISEAIQSPALKSLDSSFISQLPMIGASGDPAKEGTVGKAITKLSAMATTKDQQEFLRLYRQMAGTISGLGKLSRGGRITEATVNRLLSELPNPSNTTSSQDAIERLKRLKDEVDSALSHDSFETIAKGREAAPRKGGITPPPKPGQANGNGKLSDAAKKWLEANP